MGTKEDRCIDEKGRVTIPQAIRESLQIEPGEDVAVELEDDRIVIRPRISRSELVETIDGCINDETRTDEAEQLDPAELKADWSSDLPN